MATESKETTVSKLYPWLSILMALAVALFEWAFFFQGANWEGPSAPFAPDRLGLNLAWLTLVYLSFQLLTIPLTVGTRDRFIGVLDGMASVVPLGTRCHIRKAGTSGHSRAVGGGVPAAVNRCD
jgi:hypothetical protein